jgi:hypothetical protein
MTPKFNYVYMTLCGLTDIDLYQKIHYAIWCLLGYICSCFLHTLDWLVRGYKLSRFCTLPRKSRRFIAREQKLVYSTLITQYCDIFCAIHFNNFVCQLPYFYLFWQSKPITKYIVQIILYGVSSLLNIQYNTFSIYFVVLPQ